MNPTNFIELVDRILCVKDLLIQNTIWAQSWSLDREAGILNIKLLGNLLDYDSFQDSSLEIGSDINTLEDTCCIAPQNENGLICGEIHILLHPTYNTPSPFIRLWYQSGRLLDIVNSQGIIDRHKNLYDKSDFTLSNLDNRYYEFGRLMPDLHPVYDLPYYTLHICQLPELLSMSTYSNVVQEQGIRTSNSYIENNTVSNDPLYLLKWFSIIGPHIGINITAKIYKEVEQALLEHCGSSNK